MSFNFERSLEEQEAANIVAGLHSNKRERGFSTRDAYETIKLARAQDDRDVVSSSEDSDEEDHGVKKPAAKKKKKPAPPLDATGLIFANPKLTPAPFYYYSDHSLEPDDDPLTPVTAAGRIPTFPAKMHAILTNPALQDVVAWAPHGRSWRILKPRDFEVNVLPRYFEHSKFSSFVRQANGWGFRRLAQGSDRNAYYHEYFLRSMPWLCKKMRRPKVAEKKALDPDMEPDFDAISAVLPVPNKPITREILIVQQTIEKGPRARMPVHWATAPLETLAPPNDITFGNDDSVFTPSVSNNNNINVAHASGSSNFASSSNTNCSHRDLKPAAMPTMVSQDSFSSSMRGVNNITTCNSNKHNAEFNFDTMAPSFNTRRNNWFNNNHVTARNNNGNNTVSMFSNTAASAVASNENSTDSQFAAGFMAATAYHAQQIRKVLGDSYAAGGPNTENSNGNSSLSSDDAASLQKALRILQRQMGNTEKSDFANNHHNEFNNYQSQPNNDPHFPVMSSNSADHNMTNNHNNRYNENYSEAYANNNSNSFHNNYYDNFQRSHNNIYRSSNNSNFQATNPCYESVANNSNQNGNTNMNNGHGYNDSCNQHGHGGGNGGFDNYSSNNGNYNDCDLGQYHQGSDYNNWNNNSNYNNGNNAISYNSGNNNNKNFNSFFD